LRKGQLKGKREMDVLEKKGWPKEAFHSARIKTVLRDKEEIRFESFLTQRNDNPNLRALFLSFLLASYSSLCLIFLYIICFLFSSYSFFLG
jgi:hypothetical protein